MSRLTRTAIATMGAGALVVGLVAATPSLATAAPGPSVCTGTADSPGVLAGSFKNVLVEGFCAVDGGAAVVNGNLTLAPGSALVAAFYFDDVDGTGTSSLRVTHNVYVEKGAAMVLGCFATSFPCIDDPDQNNPTLSAAEFVGGNLVGTQALGIVAHDTTFGGDVTQTAGGGGVNCNPAGIFAVFGSPVYTTYEDSSISGSLSITSMRSCWLGTARVRIRGNATYIGDKLADPDAIEVVSNNIAGNLDCRRNSMMWDSGDLSDSLFPRQPQPNTVLGQRMGQCRLDSPTSPDDPPGPGLF
jgi:hypothetical protein